MPWHHIIDRIQIRSIQIFGVDIFPRHENQSLFQPIQGFVAVGVGPLNYDDAYVEQTTEPHPNLTGGMPFLAQRMKLRAPPPLHMAHYHKKKIFNNYMEDNPKLPSSKTFRTIAALFKAKANYKTIFLKLPSMIFSYYNYKWKATQNLVLAKEAIRGPYYDLFSVPDCNAVVERASAEFQKQAAERDKESTTAESLEATTAEGLVTAMLVTNPPLPVAPIAAPAQKTYIATVEGDGRTKDSRRCSAAPFGCPNLAKDCSRRGWKKCRLVMARSTRVQVPETEED
jgi:hypothetical protein